MRRSQGQRGLSLIVVTLCLVCVTGCAVRTADTAARGTAGGWLQSGSLALSRPLPGLPSPSSSAKAGAAALQSPENALASALTDSSTEGGATSITILKREGTLTASRPGSTPLVLKTDGTQYLREGSFSVTQKEEGPLWYAPKEYFTSRALPIPPEGSRQRFKRAALGSRAIYLNDQTPIHSGPVWLKEIGGVRVNSSAMNELYSMIQVGTRVDIR
jgi:hypothetical protein